jgi:hypothetical protein
MKLEASLLYGGQRLLLCNCIAIAFVISRAALQATTLTAASNSSATFDFNTGGGLTQWNVDSVNQAVDQWFWYRVGASGPQSDLSQISSPTITPFGSKQVTVNYANSQLAAKLVYTLSGNGIGSGKSGLTESITLSNASGAQLDLHFFMYSDFILGGASQAGNQSVSLSTIQTVTGGITNYAGASIQLFPGGSNTVSVQTAPTHVEAAPYNQTYNEITTGSGITLNDNSSAGPGNDTWAWEWDYSLGAGQVAQLSLTDAMTVPEPSVIGFGLLGAGLIALRMRKSV